jgi:putative DNA-invertase from lambdoid prophage Rac
MKKQSAAASPRTECVGRTRPDQVADGIDRLLPLLGLHIVVARARCHRPNLEAALQRIDFPGSSDAFSLSGAGIENIVRGDIGFRPMALPAGLVLSTDDERANPITALTGDSTVAELQTEIPSQDWQIVDVVLDVCSGSKEAKERAGLDRVFTMAHQKRFDVLLIWSLDRFSREGSRATITYLTRLEQLGVGFHSFTEPYLSTLGPFADSIIALLAALAKQERLRIGERTRAGLARAKANGKRLGRPKTAPDRIDEAKQLRAEKLSFGEIGKRLGISRARAFQLCTN